MLKKEIVIGPKDFFRVSMEMNGVLVSMMTPQEDLPRQNTQSVKKRKKIGIVKKKSTKFK